MDTAGIAILYALSDEARYFGDRYCALNIARENGAARIEPRLDRHARPVPAEPSQTERQCAENRAEGLYSLRIGVGPRNAFENASALLQSVSSLRAVLIVGFAGGLDAGLAPGSVAVAETVTDTLTGRCYAADSVLFATAARVSPPDVRVARGPIASTDRVLVRAAEKRDLARTTGAIAVDMESAGAAAAAIEHGVPWLAVRAITDGVGDDLPFDFNALTFQAHGDPYGGVDRGSIVASALLHPWKIPALVRLGIRSSLAARSLAAFLHALLPRISEP